MLWEIYEWLQWRERPFGHEDLKKLLWKLEYIPLSKEKRGFVISKGGFSVPRIEGVTFFDLDDLEGLLYNPSG